jgi:molecular chaperone DnaK
MNKNDGQDVIGIDLGTTFSSVSHVNAAGVVEVIPNQDGDLKTPSIVSVAGRQPVSGRAAKPDVVLKPRSVARLVKRHMGQTTEGGKPIPILTGEDGREWTPVDLSAVILRDLKTGAEKYLGHPVRAAVVCCPASFDSVARENTKAAALIAGFEQVALVEEPVAAATYYGLEKAREEVMVVFDFGGGTLDVTAIRKGQQIETLAIEGDAELGGSNYDEAILGFMCQELKAKGIEISPEKDLATWYQNLDCACGGKEMLSRREQTTLAAEAEGQRVPIELTQPKLQELGQDLDLRIRGCCDRLKAKLASLGVKPQRLILVGGSTRLPHIPALVQEIFDLEPSADTDPDLVVAKGAALIAAGKFGPEDLRIRVGGHAYLASAARTRTVAAHDLCVAAIRPQSGDTHTEYNVPIIRAGTPLPAEEQEAFAPVDAGTTAVRVKIVEGKPNEPSANSKLIGEMEVPVKPSQKDEQRIVVVMKFTDEGLLEVRGWDKVLNQPQQVQFTYRAGLTQEEIDKKRKELQEGKA